MADADYEARRGASAIATQSCFSKCVDTVRAFKERNKMGRFADKEPEEAVNHVEPDHIRMGERFEESAHGRRGVVKFLGMVPELPGRGFWVGVEFDEPTALGAGDGRAGGRVVFECVKGRGAFLRPDKVACGPQFVDRLDEELELEN
jgi:tubulin-folding cofactor B